MKFTFSSIAIGIVAFACLLVDFSLKNWEKEERVIEWDVHSYYEYLPAFFIYDDIKFEKSDYHISGDRYLFWPVYTQDGRKVIKMSMGTAFFYAPFFFTAHAYASVTDYPEDGFSEPYKLFLLLSTVFYLIVGFGFLKKILEQYSFSDKIIGTVILLIGLGTNVLCYASQSAPMSHIYSFCAFTAFIYFTIKWYQVQSVKNTVIAGLLFGLISLVRPANAVIILFFILYGVSTVSGLKERTLLFIKNYLLVIIMGICTLLVWVPQIIYWKAATGHYICYSYNDEGFFFNHPRILEGLFSWRKGWLVYTPMMAFALLGLFFLKEEIKKLRLAIIVFMGVNIYIIFSWWCWWYGGTLGQRSFIESYGLLAIPLAAFVKNLSTRKLLFNIPFYLIAVFFIWLNIFQTYQFEFHSLHHNGMTKELYFKQFGKLDRVEGFDSMVRWPYDDQAKKGISCDIPPPAGQVKKAEPKNTSETGKKEVSRKIIQLKGANGKFVCADQSASNIIIVNRDSAQGWETFTLICFENNECAILASDNKYLSITTDGKDAIAAIKDLIDKREIFLLSEVDSNHIALKAANGKYLSLDDKTLHLVAGGDSTGKQETFEEIIK